MDFGLFRSIIDEATHYGPRSFSLHLFGEPLLYPRIWDSIDYIKKKNKHHTVLLTSNGTLFERYITELTSSRVDKVIWSWRPEAKFSEALQNMRGRRTIVLIAHRLATVRNADIVFYLEQGELIAQGTFEEVKQLAPQFASQAALLGL